MFYEDNASSTNIDGIFRITIYFFDVNEYICICIRNVCKCICDYERCIESLYVRLIYYLFL